MNTKLNAKALMQIYGMSESSYYDALQPHQKELKKLATYREVKGNQTRKQQNYNTAQLDYIIKKIFGDTPYGYDYNGLTLIKNSDQ